MQIELRNIRKTFGALCACDDISMTVAPGSIHGLLGENGAGKSTLMKILTGLQPADSGAILLDGQPVQIPTPAAAAAHGIGMLYQEPLDFPNLTVLENFRFGLPAAVQHKLHKSAGQLGFAFDPGARLADLSIGERQQLEMTRLLAGGVRLLILDEPTTAISAQQREKLFAALRQLAQDGMSVIFVTHKLAEARELCGKVTVLTRGRLAGERIMPCSDAELVQLMFGRSAPVPPPAPAGPGGKDVSLLTVSGLYLADRQLELRDFSLELRPGEVIGLAGLEGSGQHLLLRACAGLNPAASGSIKLAGRELAGRNYREFLDAGAAFLPADRLGEGIIPPLTVSEHFALRERRPPFIVDRRAATEAAATCISEYAVKGRPNSPLGELSGGNQQRVLLGLLPADIRLLLLEHPTRGLDLESAAYVWTRLRERLQGGAALIFASADLDELREQSDRIIVFFAGQTKIIPARDASAAALGALIGGAGFCGT